MKEVLRKIKIGDPAVFEPSFHILSENKKLGKFICGQGFDDKAGCFILLEAIREIVKLKKKPYYTLVFTFSAQEETGYSKARPLAKKYKPELFIECDVTFATDYGVSDELEKEVGKCELGKGITLYRGVDIYEPILKLAYNIAKKNQIKVQFQAAGNQIGYTATEVTYIPTRALAITIPLRNMHTPVETISMKDLRYGINLFKHLLLSDELKKAISK